MNGPIEFVQGRTEHHPDGSVTIEIIPIESLSDESRPDEGGLPSFDWSTYDCDVSGCFDDSSDDDDCEGEE